MKKEIFEWAVIENGTVTGVYVADEDIAQAILATKGQIIKVSGLDPRPDKGWIYDNGSFTIGDQNVSE